MTLVSNVYLTHGVMLLCAVAAACNALPESTGRIVLEWRPALTAMLAALSALALIAYPTWGELKIPASACSPSLPPLLRIYVDHSWRPMRLQKAYDCLAAAVALVGLALAEIALAAIGPADQPKMELGLTVIASFLAGRLVAIRLRAGQEPQLDLHDNPSPPAEG